MCGGLVGGEGGGGSGFFLVFLFLSFIDSMLYIRFMGWCACVNSGARAVFSPLVSRARLSPTPRESGS